MKNFNYINIFKIIYFILFKIEINEFNITQEIFYYFLF